MTNPVSSLLESEPVVTRIVPVLTAVAGYLVVRGWIVSSTEDFLIALATAVVGGAGVVTARAAVRPWPAPPTNTVEDPAGGRPPQ